MLNSTMNPSRASVTKKIYLWNNGIVPYVFDSSLSTSNYSFGNHRHFARMSTRWNESFTIIFCYLHDGKIGSDLSRMEHGPQIFARGDNVCLPCFLRWVRSRVFLGLRPWTCTFPALSNPEERSSFVRQLSPLFCPTRGKLLSV